MIIKKLSLLRNHGGKIRTHGLDDDLVRQLAKTKPELVAAVDRAVVQFKALQDEFPEILQMDETEQVRAVIARLTEARRNLARIEFKCVPENAPGAARQPHCSVLPNPANNKIVSVYWDVLNGRQSAATMKTKLKRNLNRVRVIENVFYSMRRKEPVENRWLNVVMNLIVAYMNSPRVSRNAQVLTIWNQLCRKWPGAKYVGDNSNKFSIVEPNY